MRNYCLWLLGLALFTSIQSCSKNGDYRVEEVSSIFFESDSISVEEDGTIDLALSHFPSKAKAPVLEWSSSNPEIASVDNGKVVGLSMGESVITANVKGSVIRNTIKVIVTPGPYSVIPVKAIVFDKAADDAIIRSTYQLTPKILPENASDKKLTWRSSDEKIAVVTENGLVMSITAGSVDITATSADGKRQGKININFNQIGVSNITFPALKISNFYSEYDMIEANSTVSVGLNIRKQLKIEHKALPENAKNPAVIWSLSDDNLADIDQNGNLTPKKTGGVIVTATSVSNPEVSHEYRVLITNDDSEHIRVTPNSSLVKNDQGLYVGSISLRFLVFHVVNGERIVLEKLELVNSNGDIIRSSVSNPPFVNFFANVVINVTNPVKDPKFILLHFRSGDYTFTKKAPL